MIGGGFDTRLFNDRALLVQENKRDDNGWRVGGVAFGDNIDLTVFAYCLAK